MFELASRNSLHLGATYKLAKIYLDDNEKYEDGINMLISILYQKGIMSDLGECCLLALVSAFLDNVGNIARKNINDNVIVPVLDEILSLPTSFDDEIRKEVLYHIQY